MPLSKEAMREKIVCIEWDDATFNSGFYDKKTPENFEPTFTQTVGHLVRKTAKYIIVSQDRFYDSKGKPSDDRHLSIIPKKMIRRVILLNKEEVDATT